MSARPLLLAQDGTVEDPQECFRHSQILAAAGFIHPRAPVLLQVGGRPALKGVRASAGGGDGKSLSGKSVPGAYRGEKGPRLLFAGARAATAKLVGKLVANGALRAAFLFLTAATLGPRLPPVTFALPFFDGWFLRLTDHARSTTCAVIIGAMKLPMQRAFTDHYVCLSYSSAKLRAARPARPAPADHPLRLRSAHAFPGADEVRLSVDGRPLAGWSAADRFDWQAPAAGRCADFEWEARLAGDGGSGSMRVLEGGRRILLSCDLPEGADARMGAPPAEGAAAGGRVSLEAEIRAPREWGAGWETREAGPEGWLGRTGLLPCRYFVQSTGSEARYRLTRAGARGKGRETVSGSATAHVESNYGTAFPRGWVYAQVSGAQPGTSLLLVGGKFRIGLAAPVTWLAALRSPALSIDLRTTDGHAVRARFSCAARRVQLEGSDRAGARLEVTVEDCATLHARDAVWVPTLQGFSNAPGCSESFAAVARVKAWRPGPPGSHHDRPPDVCQARTHPNRPPNPSGRAWRCGAALRCDAGRQRAAGRVRAAHTPACGADAAASGVGVWGRVPGRGPRLSGFRGLGFGLQPPRLAPPARPHSGPRHSEAQHAARGGAR